MTGQAGNLAGMTVDERLAARGLQTEWCQAVKDRDAVAMRRILFRVAVPDARFVVEKVLADPAAYGF